MPDEPTMDRWRETLSDVLAPLRQQLADVEASIEAKQLELKELRNMKGEMMRVLHAADPSSRPQQRDRTGGGVAIQVSQQKLDELTDYLRENIDGAVFTVTELFRRDDHPAMSDATMRAALEHLNAAGVVVVDHVGGPGSQVRKYWKLAGAR